MAKVLIVDDSQFDQRLAGRLIETWNDPVYGVEATGIRAVYASNGLEALEVIARETPDAVVTDLQMPEMNGLDLVLQVRDRSLAVPVVLMTAHGSEDLAVQALRAGAASYVPKRDLARDLLATVRSVLDATDAKRGRERILACRTRVESHFVLENDPALIAPLVDHLRDNVLQWCGSDDTWLHQLRVALREGILNAMEHGNLELSSELRERDDNSYHHLAAERRGRKPYADRRVYVTARESPEEAVYVIRDEGPGFDTSAVPDPTDPANLEKRSGRGLLLMRMFLDEVCHNEKGNEITLVRRSKQRAAPAAVPVGAAAPGSL